MDAVVNLVGILNESGGRRFQACHVELPEKVVEACHSAGVAAPGAHERARRIALGTQRLPAIEGRRAKRACKRAAGALPVTIFRPSVIFGDGDRSLNLFATLRSPGRR